MGARSPRSAAELDGQPPDERAAGEDEDALADARRIDAERDEDGHGQQQHGGQRPEREPVAAARHEAQRCRRCGDEPGEGGQRRDVVQPALGRALYAGRHHAGDRLGREGRGRGDAHSGEPETGDRDPSGDRPARRGGAGGERRRGAERDRPAREREHLHAGGRALRVLADEVLARRKVAAQRVLEGDEADEGQQPGDDRQPEAQRVHTPTTATGARRLSTPQRPTSLRCMISDPKAWRGLSSLLIAVFIAALIVGGSGIPQWGWFALIGSGVAFAIELVLDRRSRGEGDA